MRIEIGDVIEARVFGEPRFLAVTVTGPVSRYGGMQVRLPSGQLCYAHTRDVKRIIPGAERDQVAQMRHLKSQAFPTLSASLAVS